MLCRTGSKSAQELLHFGVIASFHKQYEVSISQVLFQIAGKASDLPALPLR